MSNQYQYQRGQNHAQSGKGAANQNNQHWQSRRDYEAGYARQKQQNSSNGSRK